MKIPRRVEIDLSLPCKLWPNFVGDLGYGEVMIDGETKRVHRLAYQLLVGPIPRTWQVDHVCHTAAVERGECPGGRCAHRACYEPAHLEVVTSRENSARGNHPLFATQRRGTCLRAGHDLTDPKNVRPSKDGRRRCAVCAAERAKERKS